MVGKAPRQVMRGWSHCVHSQEAMTDECWCLLMVSFYSASDTSPRNSASHFSYPELRTPSQTCPDAVSSVVLDPFRLTIKINNPKGEEPVQEEVSQNSETPDLVHFYFGLLFDEFR